MPPVFWQRSFEVEADQQFPEHIEGWPHASKAEQDKHHIEAHDLDSGETSLIAINLDTADDAAFMLNAAITRARNSSPFSMENMQGFAIVGPEMEGLGDSRKTVGVAWRLRNGEELPAEATAVLSRFS